MQRSGGLKGFPEGYPEVHYIDTDDFESLKLIRITTSVDTPDRWTDDGCYIGAIQFLDPRSDEPDGLMQLFEAPNYRIYFWVEARERDGYTDLEIGWSIPGDPIGHAPQLDARANLWPCPPIINSEEIYGRWRSVALTI